MSLICSFGSCSSIPEFYCKCQTKATFCKIHADLHSSEDESTHELEPAFILISSSDKAKSINLIKQLIQESEDFRREIIDLTQKMMKMMQESINKLSDYKALLKKNLQELIQRNRIFSSHETCAGEEKVLKALMNLKTEFFKTENLKLFSDKLKGNLKYFQEIYSYYLKVHSDQSLINRNLCCFQTNSNKLVHFDSFKLSTRSFVLSSIEPQGCLACICFIDTKTVFCYGGFLMQNKDNAFLLNIENQTVKSLPAGIPRSCASGQFWDNRVYVFGGYSEELTKKSHYFDLIQSKWVQISHLPELQQDTSTLNVSGKILVSGYRDFLCVYDIKENNYLKCCDKVKTSYSNLLIPYLNRIILLTNRFIFTADKTDLFNWVSCSCHCLFEQTTSKPAIRGKFAYFYTMSNEIFKFDCETFELVKVNYD